jgi:hypothetical protein
LGILLPLLLPRLGLAAPLQSHAAYVAARSQIARTFSQQRAACDSLASDAQGLCLVQARALADRGRAQATVNYQGTSRSRIAEQIVNVRADFSVAQAQCVGQPAASRGDCVEEARSTRDRLLGEIRTARQSSRLTAKDNANTLDAENAAVDLSQCDALLGAERDACTASVHSSFGH